MKPPRLMGPRAAVRTALVGAVWLLSACSGALLPTPGALPTRFTLDDGRTRLAAPVAPADAAAIAVAAPRAAPGYDSRRMLYLRQPQVLQTFASHEWVAPPADLLAPLLARALEDSAAFSAVLPLPATASSPWLLESELVRLHQDFSQTPSAVRITVRAVLVLRETRHAVAWHVFDVQVAAAAVTPAGGAAAAHTAAQQVATAIAGWCVAQVQLAGPSARQSR